MDENKLKNILIKAVKSFLLKLLIICAPLIIVLSILAGALYLLTLKAATFVAGDNSNTPYAVSQYTDNVEIGKDGKVKASMTAQELWDFMKENKSDGIDYLNSPEELLKLMNAEVVTNYLDTRSNPDKPIDWNSITDINSKEIQGIIKLKRAESNGNTKTMIYADPDTYQSYIETYNKTGSEEAKENALTHFTLDCNSEEVDSSTDNVGIIKGKGSFNNYTDLTDKQLQAIANLCKQEQGSLKGAAAEASLMANRFEMVGSKFGSGGEGLYNYIRTSGWWHDASGFMDNGSAGNDYVEVIKSVLVNGKRTLPKYVDEHDCFSDIGSVTNKGKNISITDRSSYKQFVSRIKNRYGSNYIFYEFPTSTSDPFGYTNTANRKKYGDFYYDFDTGNPVNEKDDNDNSSDSNNTNVEVEDNSTTINTESGQIKYFAKVATWSETTTTIESNDPEVESSSISYYNITSTNLNYQELVSGYTMPFEYLWTLLVTGEDVDFVLELADLVYNSELEITVCDSETTNTDVVVDKYTKKKKVDSNSDLTIYYYDDMYSVTLKSDSYSGNWTDNESNEYEVKKTDITKTNTVDIILTKANVWLLDYSKGYEYVEPSETSTENTTKLDDVNFPENPDREGLGDLYNHEEPFKNEKLTAYGDKKLVHTAQQTSYKEYNGIFDREKTVTNTFKSSSYVSSPAQISEKVDKNAEENNFVKAFVKSKAKNKILDVDSWLFEILESNDTTKDMVDLTKYLLYKAIDTDYGVTEFDFSEYEYSNFNDSSSLSDDYVVKTNASNSAPVVKEKDKLEDGLKKWLRTSNSQKEKALSVVDTVMECQEKYHVNAVFVYAFLRTETGIGTANTNYVNTDNNWGSWNLGHKFSSPDDNIETITRNMESGGIYFSKGNISVSSIGAIYCPNMPQYPNQGDEWIKTVQKYMTELYSSMGISASTSGGSVASGGTGTIGVYTSTTGKKFNLYLQGSGAPWANEDYGDSHSMAAAGCGPTAEAIIASAYNGSITPSTARKDIVKKYGLGNHSGASYIKNSLNTLIPGVNVTVGKFDKNTIKNCLKNSGQVWLVVQNCKYTSAAHCIALIDYKDSDKVYVAHGTAKSRPYGWDDLSYIERYNKYSDVVYVGGK